MRPRARASAGLIGLAAGTGAAAGLSAATLWLAIEATTCTSAGSWVFLLVAPTLGGLGYGLFGHVVAPGTRGLGVPDMMLALSEPGADRPRTRVVVARMVGAVLCIGTGGSLGSEGPAVVTGSAIGHAAGVRAGFAKAAGLLGGCGIASATAVIFDAPVAGVVFALELVLVRLIWRGSGRTLSKLAAAMLRAAAVLTIAAFVGVEVRRAVVGSGSFLDVGHPGPVGLTCALLIGVAGGLAGAGFGALVYLAEDAVDRVWRGPVWLRSAAGGAALGLLLLALPQLYGTGQQVITQAAAGALPVMLVLVLAVGKAVAASTTLAVGGVGGVFAPMLFMGAMVGSAVAVLTGDHASGAALTGMAAVIAGGARIPVTAVVLTAELAGSIVPGVLVAAVVGTAAGRLVSPATVYTRKLLRRGVRW